MLHLQSGELFGEVPFHLCEHSSLRLLSISLFYWELCGQRINVVPVSKQGKVEMRSSGEGGGAHVPDHLPALDRRASFQAFSYASEMGIKRVVRARVVDTDAIAEPSIPTCVYHFATRHCTHRGAEGSGEIDTVVGPYTLQYWVKPRIGKHRRDAGKLKRVAEKRSARDVEGFVTPICSG